MQETHLSHPKKKPIFLLALCLTILGSAFIISRTGFTIRNSGVSQNGGATNTISVSGYGKTFAKPDIVNLRFSVSDLRPTSKIALEAINTKIEQALQILKENNIDEKDITTSNLSIHPEYDYQRTQRTLKGQRATQSLIVKVRNIDDKATQATSVIDALANIENIQINSISFDIDDKTELFSEARELAFGKAEQKAKELAKLGSVKLDKPVSIIDSNVDYSVSTPMTNVAFARIEADSMGGGGTEMPTGQLEVTANIQVMWGIK